jgi:hypothetical protein
MAPFALLVALAAICPVCAVTSAMLITGALARRGVRTPFPFIGVMLFRNLGLYREATIHETGRVGPLFYTYIVSINLALVLVLAAGAVRILGR